MNIAESSTNAIPLKIQLMEGFYHFIIKNYQTRLISNHSNLHNFEVSSLRIKTSNETLKLKSFGSETSEIL